MPKYRVKMVEHNYLQEQEIEANNPQQAEEKCFNYWNAGWIPVIKMDISYEKVELITEEKKPPQ